MKAIVAVDSNWGIGYKGNLLQRIPEDMRFVKQMTLNKVIVMGRETFDSLPGQQPLKDRTNIVLSKRGNIEAQNVIVCSSIDDLVQKLRKFAEEDVFVFGGASVYEELLPFCSEVFVTKLHDIYPADRHFPNLDREPGWTAEVICESNNYNGIQYSRVKYVNDKLICR